MRLTCPNCGVEYEVPEGMVPAAGRHVQCTSCHTRWFVRGGARAPASEDQILTRLENWRPRPVPVAVPAAAAPPPAPAPDAEPPADPEPVAAPAAGEAEATPEAEAAPEPVSPEPPDTPVAPQPPDAPTPPDTPAPPDMPPDTPPPPPARPAPRLDLGGDPARADPVAPRPRRFARGFTTAVLLVLLALAAYLYRAPIAGRVPAAGPALAAYAGYVDQARDEVARRYGDLRERTGFQP